MILVTVIYLVIIILPGTNKTSDVYFQKYIQVICSNYIVFKLSTLFKLGHNQWNGFLEHGSPYKHRFQS